MASPIRIISSMATRQLLTDLVAKFQQNTPQQVSIESVGGVDAAKRVQAGEAIDVVVLASNVIDQLIDAGRLAAGSRVDLATSGVVVAVRSGAAHPDIGSEEAVKRAVLAASSVGYSTGPSGVYLTKLFERWGIADQIKGRTVLAPPGVPVGTLMAKGEVELGFQQMSEMIGLPGIDIVGPLPPELQIITTFSAGVSSTCTQVDAVNAMLAFMASPEADVSKRNSGMEPA